jgi:chromate transporter
MPSALAMIAFGYGVSRLGDLTNAAWLHGLKIVAVAVAVVANAVWGMARSLCPDRQRATIAIGAAVVALALPPSLGQVAAIATGGVIGWWFLRDGAPPAPNAALAIPLPRSLSIACLVLFFVLMAGLPLLTAVMPSHALAEFPRRRAGVRRGPCRAAAAAGRSGAARLDVER